MHNLSTSLAGHRLSSTGWRLYEALWQKSQEDLEKYPRWCSLRSGALPALHGIMEPLQKALHAAIIHYGTHWDQFLHLIPHAPKVRALLERMRGLPYHPGTYRPDFLFDMEGVPRVCEINARFPLNLFLFSLYAHGARGEPLPEHSIALTTLRYLEARFGPVEGLALVHRSEPMFDAQILREAASRVGLVLPVFTGESLHKLEDEVILINELTQEELLGLPQASLAQLQGEGLNDLRTVFLIHDKRFLSLLHEEEFLQSMGANLKIRALFERHILPTFTVRHEAVWDHAGREREQFVLKHAQLGKSKGLMVGRSVSGGQWGRGLREAQRQPYVLQRFLPQRRFTCDVSDTPERYLLGGMMCCDDHLFGQAVFRAVVGQETAGCLFVAPAG